MKNAVPRSLCLVTVGLLCLAPYALADSTVPMLLTGAGSNVMDGVYVGAYTAMVNGVSTQVVCDDYADDSYLNESWKASVTNYSSLSSTKWTSPAGYNEAAWLVLQMFSSSNQTTIGEIQYAIWGIFDSNAITDLTNYNYTYGQAAQGWINQAAKQTYTTGEFSNFLVYTPVSGTETCNGGPCPTPGPPQEFLSVHVPESAFFPTLAGDMLGFALIAVALRRRFVRPGSRVA
jgi:hypothetical protein